MGASASSSSCALVRTASGFGVPAASARARRCTERQRSARACAIEKYPVSALGSVTSMMVSLLGWSGIAPKGARMPPLSQNHPNRGATLLHLGAADLLHACVRIFRERRLHHAVHR